MDTRRPGQKEPRSQSHQGKPAKAMLRDSCMILMKQLETVTAQARKQVQTCPLQVQQHVLCI